MVRPDISNKLIHFTSAESWSKAFDRLRKILADRALLAGTGNIRGGFRCVCLTEAPLPSLPGGFVNCTAYSKYAPFGLMFEKKWIFEQGGRPVIYQPRNEFDLLPEQLAWRHVTYEPDEIDFTWEREWRIKMDALQFESTDFAVLLPNEAWCEMLQVAFEVEQDFQVLQYEMIMDRTLAEQYREEFPWSVCLLNIKDP